MPSVSINPLIETSWKNMPGCTFELGTWVDIWRIKISSGFNLFKEMLAPAEVIKMNRYRQQNNRDIFLASRGGLRYLSGKYLRQPQEACILGRDKNKKPSWEHPGGNGLHFNIAHSGGYVLIAFAHEEVGIDVENTNSDFAYTEILPRCFRDQEINLVQTAVNPRALFYLLWTRKEALLKATAKGIHNDLPLVPCMDGLHPINSVIIGSVNDWAIDSFEMNGGYTVSIAHHPSVKAIRCWDFDAC